MTDTIYYLASCDTCRKIIKRCRKKCKLEVPRHKTRSNYSRRIQSYAFNLEAKPLFSKSAKPEINRDGSKKNKFNGRRLSQYILEHYTFIVDQFYNLAI
jgi:arsenate reductase